MNPWVTSHVSKKLGLETCGSGWNEPLVPDNPLGFKFSGCCQNHDNCDGWSCGKCDKDFCGCMRKHCETYGGFMHLRRRCDAWANFYCDVVSDNGAGPYRDARKKCGKKECS